MTEEIIARLRSLDLSDGGSHSRLSAIASCFYQPTFGWTRGACETLRDKLIETMEGKDGNDDNDHADDCNCAHHRCDQHGRQVSYDELGNERQKAIAELRDIQTDAGGFVKALANALGVEWQAPRVHQIIAEVRDRLIHLIGGDLPTFCDLFGIWQAGEESESRGGESAHKMTKSAEIGESGVDSTNGQSHESSPMRQENETRITDELREFATDPLLGYASQELHVERITAIADRIDEQFDRICEQQEKVLQATIDGMCEEQDRLQERLRTAELGCDANHRLAEANVRWCDELVDLLRDAAKEYKTLDQMSAETSANFHAMRDRAWGLEAERDELQSTIDKMMVELESARAKNRRLARHIAQMQGGSKKWREKCEALMAERDELRRSLRQIVERAGVPHDRDLSEYGDGQIVRAIIWQLGETQQYVKSLEWVRDRRLPGIEAERDELQAKLDEYDKTHMELPKDSEGEYVHIGDEMEDMFGGTCRVIAVSEDWFIQSGDSVCCKTARKFRHRKPITVEQVIRDLTLGKITESQAVERIGDINGQG